MNICCLTFVIPEIIYREYGLKPDSRLSLPPQAVSGGHAGMTNTDERTCRKMREIIRLIQE